MASQNISTDSIISGVNDLLVTMGLDTVKQDIIGIKDMISGLQSKHIELQASLEHSDLQHTETRKLVQNLKKDNTGLRTRLELSENRIIGLEKSLQDCKNKIVDCQFHTMKNNMVFSGIQEHDGEDIRAVLLGFMVSVMKIDQSRLKLNEYDINLSTDENTVWVQRCHRFGVKRAGFPRPIVAVLTSGRDCILRHAKNLAGTKFFVSSQLPPEVGEQKKKMLSVLKAARRDGKRARFIGRGDAILVDNEVITPTAVPTCNLPPEDIISRREQMNIRTTSLIKERGNTFVGISAKVHNAQDISSALVLIKNMHPDIASATHNVYAARIGVSPNIIEYSDDDGEYGGAAIILKALKDNNTKDCLVVVSRKDGRQKLGQRRWDIIAKCTNDVTL